MGEPRDPKHADGTFLAGVVSGVLIGLLLGAAIMGMAVYRHMRRRLDAAYHNLIPVVVAAQDIPANTPISFDLLSQRSISERCVTPSTIKPDGANRLIGERSRVALQAGDVLFSYQFEDAKLSKQAFCLLAARDIPIGTRLTEADLEDRELATDLATASFIRQSERPQILGQAVTTAFRKGDPILWTHFQVGAPPSPHSPKK